MGWCRAGVAGVMLLLLCSGSAFVACGARTGIPSPDSSDAADIVTEYARDATANADGDADGSDAPLPPPTGCDPDAGPTPIHLLAQTTELVTFYPPTQKFTSVGYLDCSIAGGPNSMAVERSGIAYVAGHDGRLYRVDTTNAHCTQTSYVPEQLGFLSFGMGYAGDQTTESLYVSDTFAGHGLGIIDTTSMTLSAVGKYVPPLPERCELSGSSDDRLFAFCLGINPDVRVVAEVDRHTAKVSSKHVLSTVADANAFAFARWGDAFYIFTSVKSVGTKVTKYDPATQAESVVAIYPVFIVGAGVSTCAPR
jgi:hypothetical protein